MSEPTPGQQRAAHIVTLQAQAARLRAAANDAATLRQVDVAIRHLHDAIACLKTNDIESTDLAIAEATSPLERIDQWFRTHEISDVMPFGYRLRRG